MLEKVTSIKQQSIKIGLVINGDVSYFIVAYEDDNCHWSSMFLGEHYLTFLVCNLCILTK